MTKQIESNQLFGSFEVVQILFPEARDIKLFTAVNEWVCQCQTLLP